MILHYTLKMSYAYIYTYIMITQIEQEMGLIVGKADIRSSFERAWTASFVPALLQYGERSKRKAIKDIHSGVVDTGMFTLCLYTCLCLYSTTHHLYLYR